MIFRAERFAGMAYPPTAGAAPEGEKERRLRAETIEEKENVRWQKRS